ncbi:hypothetical protein Tco_0420553 [Tanacetum coccineum]
MEILPVSTSNSTAVDALGTVVIATVFGEHLVHVKSDSLPHAYNKALKVKHSASRLLLLNKNVISQRAQVHVKFGNSNNHELLHNQRDLESNKEVFSREIVSLRSILWEMDKIDEEEEVASF